MYQTIERTMTGAERKRLLDCMPLEPSPFRSGQFWQRLLTELAGVALAVVLLLFVNGEPAETVIPVAIGFYALWWVFQFKLRILEPLRGWREANRRALAMREAVAAAQTVRVHCVEAEAVVEVTHDEGTIALFDVGPGQTYWIDPYFMIPGRPPKDWPNRKFEVVEIPGVEDEFGPFSSGKRLRPRESVEFRDLFGHYAFEPSTDGLIPQSLDAFLSEAKQRSRTTAGMG